MSFLCANCHTAGCVHPLWHTETCRLCGRITYCANCVAPNVVPPEKNVIACATCGTDCTRHSISKTFCPTCGEDAPDRCHARDRRAGGAMSDRDDALLATLWAIDAARRRILGEAEEDECKAAFYAAEDATFDEGEYTESEWDRRYAAKLDAAWGASTLVDNANDVCALVDVVYGGASHGR